MSNMFDQTRNKWGGSPYVIWVFTIGALLLGIGIVLFIEDMMSSLQGIQQLETAFDIDPVNIQITYYAIALSSQVAQIGFMFLFLIDTKKNRWALGVVAFFFVVDLVSDVQDRSGSWLFSDSGVHLDARTGVATALSLVFFTIGSELFISTGFGLTLALFKPAKQQIKLLLAGDKQRGQAQPQGRQKGSRPDPSIEAMIAAGVMPDAPGQPRIGRGGNMQMTMPD